MRGTEISLLGMRLTSARKKLRERDNVRAPLQAEILTIKKELRSNQTDQCGSDADLSKEIPARRACFAKLESLPGPEYSMEIDSETTDSGIAVSEAAEKERLRSLTEDWEIVIDSDDDDDGVQVLSVFGPRPKRINYARVKRLDREYRLMVQSSNRASDSDKQRILDFMDGGWRRPKSRSRRSGIESILLGKDIELIQPKPDLPKQLAVVDTVLFLDHDTGKLSSTKSWKPV